MAILNLDRLPGDEYSEVRYRIKDYFIVGFERSAFLGEEIYVTLQALPEAAKTPVSVLRMMKREFEEFYGATYWCEIDIADKRALRFAEFFGFEPIGWQHKRIYCIRKM